MLFWGAVTGGFVYGISYLSFEQPFRAVVLLHSILIGTVYVVAMSSCMRTSKCLIDRYIPLRTKGAVLIHTLLQSISILVSFIAITALLKLALGDAFPVDGRFLRIVALVAFSAAFIGHSFSYMHDFHQRMREAEARAYEAQLQTLRAQVNPHFLFNVFNSIAALIRSRPDEAEAAVEDLADLFRYTLQASKRVSASLGEELRAAKLYLGIEKIRFRDRLRVQIDVPEVLQAVRVPSMTIQPLVENAVKHGVGRTDTPCTVTVSAAMSNGCLHLRVTDTGPGFDTTNPDPILARGTGLANVRGRLRILFGSEATFSIHPQGIQLTMPLNTGDGAESSSSEWRESDPRSQRPADIPD